MKKPSHNVGLFTSTYFLRLFFEETNRCRDRGSQKCRGLAPVSNPWHNSFTAGTLWPAEARQRRLCVGSLFDDVQHVLYSPGAPFM